MIALPRGAAVLNQACGLVRWEIWRRACAIFVKVSWIASAARNLEKDLFTWGEEACELPQKDLESELPVGGYR